MARVRIVPLKPDLPVEKIWLTILNYLTLNESVEVIVRKTPAGTPKFLLHVWDGPRKDRSNTTAADPAAEY